MCVKGGGGRRWSERWGWGCVQPGCSLIRNICLGPRRRSVGSIRAQTRRPNANTIVSFRAGAVNKTNWGMSPERRHSTLNLPALKINLADIVFGRQKCQIYIRAALRRLRRFKQSSGALRKTVPARRRSPINLRITANLLSFEKKNQTVSILCCAVRAMAGFSPATTVKKKTKLA